jgi:protein required for attachment to host cells
MPTTWILIADGARARLLEQDRKSRRFKPTSEQEFFGSRAQSKEIASDDRGRSFDSAGRGQPGDIAHGRHAMEPPTDPQRYAEYAFARDLADHLEKAANQHRFVSSWSPRPRRWAICAVFCPRPCRAGSWLRSTRT